MINHRNRDLKLIHTNMNQENIEHVNYINHINSINMYTENKQIETQTT
jgi:hypothetical protein